MQVAGAETGNVVQLAILEATGWQQLLPVKVLTEPVNTLASA